MQTNNDEKATKLFDKACALSKKIKEIEAIDTVQAYEKVSQKIRANSMTALRRWFIRIAACLTIPLLLSTIVLALMQLREQKEPVRYAEIKALRGSVLRYELPDSTVVWLNSGSRLRYPTKFQDSKRQVELTGEGYFEVSASKKRPFYVNTSSGLNVYVYGTKFNISAYENDETVETTLESGVLNLLIPSNNSTQVMHPGELISYDKRTHKITRTTIDASEKTAWCEGKLIFRDASIEEIFARLERQFNVEIRLSNPKNRHYRYRATFRNETIYQILNYLSHSTDMTWRREIDSTQTKTTIYVTLN